MKLKSMKVVAIIPAAGIGIRMGKSIPKQFLSIKGIPVLALTLKAFQRSDLIDHIVVVVPENEINRSKDIIREYGISKVYKVIAGGKRRQDSVRIGLDAIKEIMNDSDLVVIHDGVRPFIDIKLIDKVILEAENYPAVVVGYPAKDTLKEVDEKGYITSTLKRDKIWLIQTPQVFRFKDIFFAHQKAWNEDWEGITDDSMLIERLGFRVKVIKGDEKNIKITTPFDLELAEYIFTRYYA